MSSLKQIRHEFLSYFEKNNHKILPSSSVIPENDPTLMFVNSGMVQFKNIFTGLEKTEYNKVATSQKSIRAGGKHNDLDNVGYTARHHTFFEMLGNFSFGDYFKEEAIYYAWNLLTKNFAIPKEKLYVTIYYTDDEAANLWKKVAGLSSDRVIRIKTNDNFWSMGPTGPCGPSCEIFYDHGDKIFGGLPGTKDEDGDRYIEIWNMVFMQYEQLANGSRVDLPKKSIDTGMGLERISTILQGVHDNYDIDLFITLIKELEELIGIKITNKNRSSYRVVADHIRSSAFLISDGVMPSNEGRGYVLRRIIRRAVRHIHQLGAKEAILHKLLAKLIAVMGDEYDELDQRKDYIANILLQEEERFQKTIDKGLKLIDKEISNLNDKSSFSGSSAFKLYDTYGFPLDLTQDILKAKNIKVNKDEFNKEMFFQKERARNAHKGSGDSKIEDIWFDILNDYGSTEFLGYTHNKSEAKILGLIIDGKKVNQVNAGDKFILITNQTPFYGESGGQMGDIGWSEGEDYKLHISDTKKYLGKIIAHMSVLEKGSLSLGDVIKLNINITYRQKLRNNHSATHILHSVLKKILGNHVNQKGSLVSDTRLRFDITMNKSLNSDLINKIEDEVNRIILGNYNVTTLLMDKEKAIEKGALGLFGEKYDSEVRVVSIGSLNNNSQTHSIELCGGTHVSNTGEIGLFKIISESSIGSGIRRIEAITGVDIVKYLRNKESILDDVSNLLYVPHSEIRTRLDLLKQDNLILKGQLKSLQMKEIIISDTEIKNNSVKINNAAIIGKEVKNLDSNIVRDALEKSLNKNENLIAYYYITNNNKITLMIGVGKIILKTISAKSLIHFITTKLLGKASGGGNNIAQTGGFSNIDMDKTLNLIRLFLKEHFS